MRPRGSWRVSAGYTGAPSVPVKAPWRKPESGSLLRQNRRVEEKYADSEQHCQHRDDDRDPGNEIFLLLELELHYGSNTIRFRSSPSPAQQALTRPFAMQRLLALRVLPVELVDHVLAVVRHGGEDTVDLFLFTLIPFLGLRRSEVKQQR